MLNSAYGDKVNDANKIAKAESGLAYLWTDSKVRLAARVGANVDFRVSDRISLGLEVSANTLSDHYNSKKAGNPDWYFNALVGSKIALGKTHTTKTIPAPKPVEKIIERVIEKQIVPAPVETKKEVAQKSSVVISSSPSVTLLLHSHRHQRLLRLSTT